MKHREDSDTIIPQVSPTVQSGPPFSRTGNERVECDALIPMVAPCIQSGSSNAAAHGARSGDFKDGCLIPSVVGALSDGAHQGGGLMDRTPTVAGLSRCLTGKMQRLDSETETFVVTK